MGNSRIISNIEPFNDIWYKNCFYSALFPVIQSFNKSITPILLNEIYYYSYRPKSITLQYEVNERFSEDEISRSMGILVKANRNDDIFDQIINAIDSNNPVILFIDCFYESIRPDAYLKNHFPHYILIIGYNSSEKEFHIIEHQYRDSFTFEKRTISFSDIIKSYSSALVYFQDQINIPTYYEFSSFEPIIQNPNDNEFWVQSFYDHLGEQEQLIKRGISNIEQFTIDLESVVSNERDFTCYFEENHEVLFEAFNTIIRNKEIEIYRLKKVFGSIELTKNLEHVHNHWCIIRGMFWKYKFSNSYDVKFFRVILDRLNIISKNEHVFHESLFDCVNKGRGQSGIISLP